MTLHELSKNYCFHDSTIVGLDDSPQTSTLRLTLEFCCFMQEDFVEGEPECRELTLTFDGVPEFAADESTADGTYRKMALSDLRCSDGTYWIDILDCTENDGSLLFFCQTSPTHRSEDDIDFTLRIRASDVTCAFFGEIF